MSRRGEGWMVMPMPPDAVHTLLAGEWYGEGLGSSPAPPCTSCVALMKASLGRSTQFIHK